MLRFKPDGWLEGLLRPFILADPHGFVYFELPAPDLRFAVLALLTVAALTGSRLRSRLSSGAWRTLVGLWLAFYAWTFVIGNGRYFIVGLLIAGPIIVMLVGALPISRSMRVVVLASAVGLQGVVVHQHLSQGAWALARWVDGPGLRLPASPLRQQPAVFITISSISHSILVPQFDRRSHWVNLAGQVHITPKTPEWGRLRGLLMSPLPKYVVLPVPPGHAAAGSQPSGELAKLLQATLERHGLQLGERQCDILSSYLVSGDAPLSGKSAPALAYWFCLLTNGPAGEPAPPAEAGPWLEAFAAVERRCPRYFPPGEGKLTMVSEHVAVHHYQNTDTRLYVDALGNVMYRYLRALNPTFVGTVDQVLAGAFALDCDKLPGRYVYPWEHE
jgi:hypothetical protein